MKSIWTLLSLSTFTAAALIQTLTRQNFTSFVASQELSFVQFYVPWCVHCRDLEPEFETAAAKLQPHDLPLARVNCEDDLDLCTEIDIPIYPTLLVYHHAQSEIYNGWRTADAMVAFVTRHSHPLVTSLSSADEVVAFSGKDKVVVVGYYDEDDLESAKIFTEVAESRRNDFLFGSISDQAFGEAENLNKPSIVLYKSFDKGKSSLETVSFDGESMREFLDEHAYPLIGEIEVDVGFRSPPLSKGNPVVLIFAESGPERASLAVNLKQVANTTRNRMAWVTIDPVKHVDVASRAAVQMENWPALAIWDPVTGDKYAYPVQGSSKDLDEMAIQKFVNEFLSGTLKPSIRSQAVPTHQNSSIVETVGLNYDDTISRKGDVLMLYYSPTCKHCENLAPVYEKLGKVFGSSTYPVTVARIDATQNDVSPPIDSFPTIKFFKANHKTEPVTYEGDRSLEDIAKFVEDNSRQELASSSEVIIPGVEKTTEHNEL